MSVARLSSRWASSTNTALLRPGGASQERHQPPPLARWSVVALASLGAGLQYTMRCNLSVAMTRMPEQYGWSDGWDGPLLSALFCGYMVGQVPASWLWTGARSTEKVSLSAWAPELRASSKKPSSTSFI